MDSMKDYFLCDKCQGKDFVKLYNFSVSFRMVNFSDDPVHDEVKEEIYRCTQCQKTFTKSQIDVAIKEMISQRRQSFVGTGEGRG